MTYIYLGWIFFNYISYRSFVSLFSCSISCSSKNVTNLLLNLILPIQHICFLEKLFQLITKLLNEERNNYFPGSEFCSLFLSLFLRCIGTMNSTVSSRNERVFFTGVSSILLFSSMILIEYILNYYTNYNFSIQMFAIILIRRPLTRNIKAIFWEYW